MTATPHRAAPRRTAPVIGRRLAPALLPPLLLAATLTGAAGCINATSEATFIGGRDLDLCSGVYHQCPGLAAGCVLDENHYLEGTFPGERKFLVETPEGDYKIRVSIYVRSENRLSPGTETQVTWYETGCGDEYTYELSEHRTEGDLFEQAGRDQVFSVEHDVVEQGGHLVTVWSDAICRYLLRAEALPQD